MMKKYKMNVEQNVFYAKRNLVDTVFKSANLEGIAVTYPETQQLLSGGNVARLKMDEIVAINNIKHAWSFILSDIDIPLNYGYVCHIHKIVGANLIYGEGKIRNTPVNIGGTSWIPPLPIESQLKEQLELLLDNDDPTEKSIQVMLWIMRTQMFLDGNKRVATLAGNKIMIEHGCGIISIPIEHQATFYEKLIRFYETNEADEIKEFIYEKCINGIDFVEEEVEEFQQSM